MQDWLEKVRVVAEQVCARESCILYDLEFVGAAKGRTLRVYIDKDNGGASIDDCSNVSKGMNLLLDVEDCIPGGAYQLEVSTPGLDRVLRQKWHFDKMVGQKIWIRTSTPVSDLGVTHPKFKTAKQLTEILQGLEDNSLVFMIDNERFVIPLEKVEKAKAVFEFKQNKKR